MERIGRKKKDLRGFLFLSGFLLLPSFVDSLDESTRSLLTSAVLDLPLSSFKDDLRLFQEASPSFLNYVLPSSGTPLFIQNSTKDLNKRAIVLESGQDRLPHYQNKKVFVVLRKGPQPHSDLYWVLMAYIRNTPEGKKIEWDAWDDRSVASQFNKASLFGWTTCRSSSVVPCKTQSAPEAFELIKIPPTSSIDFSSTKKYLSSSSSAPPIGAPFHSLEFFSDISSLEKNSASLAGLIVDAMVFSRSLYALLLPQYDSLRPQSPDISSLSSEPPALCGEGNDLETLDLCPPGSSSPLDSSQSLLTSKLLLDIKVNDLASLRLGSSFNTLLQSGHSLSEVNTLGVSLLQGLLDNSESSKNRVTRFRRSPSHHLHEFHDTWVLQTKVDLFTHLGWTVGKREDEEEEEQDKDELGEEEDEHSVFRGIGGCPGGNVSLERLNNLKKPEEILDFYLEALGTHCIPFMRERVMRLLHKGHLAIKSENTLSGDSHLRNKKKLSQVEMEELSLVVELWAFSRNLAVFLKLTSEMKMAAPVGRFPFISTFALDFVSLSHKHFALHSVKLRRNLLRTLQSLFTKSLQNVFRVQYKYCDNCVNRKMEVSQAKKEPQQLLGLIGYLASEDLESLGFEDLYKKHLTWVSTHKDHISTLLASFTKSL